MTGYTEVELRTTTRAISWLLGDVVGSINPQVARDTDMVNAVATA